MKILKISSTDIRALEYSELIKSTWKRDFIEDFGGEYFSCDSNMDRCDIYIAEEEGKVLGGAIISDDIFVNQFSTPRKIQYKTFLQSQGYKALVYLIINPKYRGKGVGSNILNHILERYEKIWLSYEPGTIPFYEKSGCIPYLEGETSNPTGLMIHHRKT